MPERSDTGRKRGCRERARAAAALLAVFQLCGTGVVAAQPANRPDPPPVRELDPESAERLHNGMLELRQLERENDRAGAIRVGEDLLHRFPDEPRVEEALIRLYRLDGREDKLVRLLTRRVERDPNDLNQARELATSLLGLGKQAQAQSILQKVIAANPADEARYRMAAALFRAHRNLDQAALIYRQGRKAIGRETLFAIELAQLEEARGDYTAAMSEYLLLVMDPEQRPRARRKIVHMLESVENPNEVLSRVQDLQHKHPKSAAVQDIAATAYLQAGKLDEAFTAVQAADRYAGDQGEHLLELGKMALQTVEGQPVNLERARLGVRVLQLLPKAHPESNLIPEASRLLAEGLVAVARQVPQPATRQELLREAVQALDMTVADKRFANLRGDAMALKALILFEDLGQPQAAIETFQALIADLHERGEPDQVVRVQMALCLAALGKFGEARTELQAVAGPDSLWAAESQLDSRPGRGRRPVAPEALGRARARYQLAELDLIEGQYERAIDGFAALAAQAPEDRMSNDCLDLALILTEASMGDTVGVHRYSQYRGAIMRRDPAAARAELVALVAEPKESALHALALYQLANDCRDSGDTAQALEKYGELVQIHAEHRLAPRALEAIGDLQRQKLGHPELAVQSYERILMDYPDDLFLDDVREKLLAARQAQKEQTDATP
jgi:tetratricopeptide (TPR) repeat protein